MVIMGYSKLATLFLLSIRAMSTSTVDYDVRSSSSTPPLPLPPLSPLLWDPNS